MCKLGRDISFLWSPPLVHGSRQRNLFSSLSFLHILVHKLRIQSRVSIIAPTRSFGTKSRGKSAPAFPFGSTHRRAQLIYGYPAHPFLYITLARWAHLSLFQVPHHERTGFHYLYPGKGEKKCPIISSISIAVPNNCNSSPAVLQSLLRPGNAASSMRFWIEFLS